MEKLDTQICSEIVKLGGNLHLTALLDELKNWTDWMEILDENSRSWLQNISDCVLAKIFTLILGAYDCRSESS